MSTVQRADDDLPQLHTWSGQILGHAGHQRTGTCGGQPGRCGALQNQESETRTRSQKYRITTKCLHKSYTKVSQMFA